MTTPDAPETETPTCCGLGAREWKGGPLVLGCKLCPRSDTYWDPERRAARLADLEAQGR